jgi:molybdate transport system substrate-binding protein
MSQSITRRAACIGLAASFLLMGAAQAADVRVVSSGGFAAAYRSLAPEFERRTGHKLVTDWGPSMGTTTNAVPQRLARNEPVDAVIMVGYALG